MLDSLLHSIGVAMPDNTIDFAKLLGFAAVRDEVSTNVDLQADVINAKLGAKVGFEVMNEPSKLPGVAKDERSGRRAV
jgi:hypothetical protein